MLCAGSTVSPPGGHPYHRTVYVLSVCGPLCSTTFPTTYLTFRSRLVVDVFDGTARSDEGFLAVSCARSTFSSRLGRNTPSRRRYSGVCSSPECLCGIEWRSPWKAHSFLVEVSLMCRARVVLSSSSVQRGQENNVIDWTLLRFISKRFFEMFLVSFLRHHSGRVRLFILFRSGPKLFVWTIVRVWSGLHCSD